MCLLVKARDKKGNNYESFFGKQELESKVSTLYDSRGRAEGYVELNVNFINEILIQTEEILNSE